MMSNYTFLNLILKFRNKTNLVSHHKSKLVSLQVVYTRHSTLYMYISCAAVQLYMHMYVHLKIGLSRGF